MDATQPIALSSADALALRYGAQAAPPAGPWNDHISLLLSHRSIRGYRPDALPTGTPETLIDAAQSVVTSSNLQTWSVIAVTDPEKKAALAKVASNQKHIEQCPLFLVWVADIARNQRLGAEENVALETILYQETFLVVAINAALTAQNAILAAESPGLARVGALRDNPAEVARLVGLPPGAFGVFGMCVGCDYVTNEVKPRLPQEVIVHHDTYDATGERCAEGRLLCPERNGRGHLDQTRRRPHGQDCRHVRTRQAGWHWPAQPTRIPARSPYSVASVPAARGCSRQLLHPGRKTRIIAKVAAVLRYSSPAGDRRAR